MVGDLLYSLVFPFWAYTVRESATQVRASPGDWPLALLLACVPGPFPHRARVRIQTVLSLRSQPPMPFPLPVLRVPPLLCP
jgi:hypothetical protein